MPQAQRSEPLHLQISRFYQDAITEGRLLPGEQLPSIRDITRAWTDSNGAPIGQNTAQRAVEHLKAGGLVRTGSDGTFAAEPRAAIGPQQRMRLTAAPASERQEMLGAGLVPVPGYIRPILDLAAGSRVLRREWLTWEDGRPSRLTVTWHDPLMADDVPQLLEMAPLPDPRGAPAMAGLDAASLRGGTGFECRAAKDDGREIPLLRLEPGAFVLAGVWTWRDETDVIEYGEYVLPPGRVITCDLEP